MPYGRNLASLQTPSHAVNYTYDADGLRVTKTVDTPPKTNRDRLRWSRTKHTYQYVDGLLMYETRGDLTFIYDYDAYGHLSCITYMWANGSYWNFYVACNARGDVTAIYAADGTLRATYTYDSWGNTVSIIDRYGNNIVALGDDAIAADNIGALNRIRYRGYYYDYESGLYYLQSRYYDPQVKRFVNADSYVSTGQGLTSTNMFAYCLNNPVNLLDSTGNSAIAIGTGLLLGLAIVGLGFAALSVVDGDAARRAAAEVETAIQDVFSRDATWDEEQKINGPQVIERAEPRATPTAVAAEKVATEEKELIIHPARRTFDFINGSQHLAVDYSVKLTLAEAVAVLTMPGNKEGVYTYTINDAIIVAGTASATGYLFKRHVTRNECKWFETPHLHPMGYNTHVWFGTIK